MSQSQAPLRVIQVVTGVALATVVLLAGVLAGRHAERRRSGVKQAGAAGDTLKVATLGLGLGPDTGAAELEALRERVALLVKNSEAAARANTRALAVRDAEIARLRAEIALKKPAAPAAAPVPAAPAAKAPQAAVPAAPAKAPRAAVPAAPAKAPPAAVPAAPAAKALQAAVPAARAAAPQAASRQRIRDLRASARARLARGDLRGAIHDFRLAFRERLRALGRCRR